MKLKHEFEFMELEGDFVAVPIGENGGAMNGLIKMNDSAKAVLQLLQEDITETDIVNALANEYTTGKDEIAAYVHELIELLQAKDMLA